MEHAKMRLYSIFDDFGEEPKKILESAGINVDVHPKGVPRPDDTAMKLILEEYDGVIIGTSQKISEGMFENINTPKLIATASVGLDHITIPPEKRNLVAIYNTPKANAQSVAEYTMACALACCKRLYEGGSLYSAGKNNKALSEKPDDLNGKVIGVVGAGNISLTIMRYAAMFGMSVLYWTAHPELHKDISFEYTSLNDLVEKADVISVNLPDNEGTKGLISPELVRRMKENCIFISVSRKATIDLDALIARADQEKNFYVNVDVDYDNKIRETIEGKKNVLVTPHIAGGTIETRKRMFKELSETIVNHLFLN